jgi:UDP-N-acetylmuramoyl-L-alanyl-D-glutamate--2,6-diaminopimelate ligase
MINIDNDFGKRLANEITLPFATYSLRNKSATWHLVDLPGGNGSNSVSIRGEGGILIEGEINLIGDFNLENLLLAVGIAAQSGVDPIVIANALPHLTGAPGRLEKVDLGQEFLALVDYAHTPDAVIKVLETVAANKQGRIIGVLGCGGDRDKGKRSLMGRALSELCDVAIFTSDNPRSEDPKSILQDMLSGVENSGSVKVIEDRTAAILHSVSIATKGDVVIILGKGHETGQEVNGIITPFSDQHVLEQAIRAQQ